MNRIDSGFVEGLKRNNSSISSLQLNLLNADSDSELVGHAILNAYQENNSNQTRLAILGPHPPTPLFLFLEPE